MLLYLKIAKVVSHDYPELSLSSLVNMIKNWSLTIDDDDLVLQSVYILADWFISDELE